MILGPDRYNRGMTDLPVPIDNEALATFCRRNHVRKLAIFGSAVTERFSAASDVDVLVEFEPGHTPGLRFIALQEELSHILGGHKVDLVTPQLLHPSIREQVLADAEVQFVAA